MEEDGKTNPLKNGWTSELLEIEKAEHSKQMALKAERLSRVATQIESILVEEGMTWGEWGEVVELFSTRIGQMVAQIKVTKY